MVSIFIANTEFLARLLLSGSLLSETNIQNFSRQALHASKIRFPSIKGESFFEFEADLPQDMQSLIKKME